jgi:hypothetical protein
MVGASFSLGGEIAPSVEIFFQRVSTAEIAPEVFLGIYADRFEDEWRERLKKTGLSAVGGSPALGLHIANVSSLRPRPWSPFLPSAHDVDALEGWLDRVFEYATQLPSSVQSLANAITRGRILEEKLLIWMGHPVKVRAFSQWLTRTYNIQIGDDVLRLLEDRTEPYDVDIMLGPP